MVDEEQPPKSVADSSNSSNTHINKKRRLSKRERKNLKKKAKLTSDAPNKKSIANDTAKSSSTVTANNLEPPHTQPRHARLKKLSGRLIAIAIIHCINLC